MKKSQGKRAQQWGILVNGLRAELAIWRIKKRVLLYNYIIVYGKL